MVSWPWSNAALRTGNAGEWRVAAAVPTISPGNTRQF